jgi:long-chain fatty acid transport protein
MSFRHVKSLLLACSGAAALLGATLDANAGGLEVREQSAYGQGSSYAGVAAGGSLSSMFYNPATLTQMPGINSESSLTGIIPSSVNNPNAGVGTGNVAISALVPSSYYSWQFNQKLWLGLSVNAPYGLAESFPDTWAGRAYAAGGENLKTYNFAPTIAYKLNDWLSFGLGAQIQYASASFTQGIALLGPTNQVGVSGAGYGYGWTAGFTLTPSPNTTIGLGYRSAINQKINGTMVIPAALNAISTPGSVNTQVNLPDTVSLGLRQKLTSQWTALGTVEWANWSRIGNSNILQPSGAPATVAFAPVVIDFQYKNSWFFSAGAEYQWSPQLALRAGAAYELSPVSDTVRVPAVPDDDRFWLSLGATYKYNAKTSIDFAYSHVFVKSAPITLLDTSNPSFNGTLYSGSVSSQIDIISLALKYRWDDPTPEPVKQRYAKAK